MFSNRYTNGGYVGLLSLLVVAALIGIFVWRTDLFSADKSGKNMIEQGNDAIDKANAVKDLLEARDKQSVAEELK